MSRLCEEVAAHSADAAIYFRLRSGYGPLPGASTYMDLDCRSRFGSLAMTRSAVLWTFAGGVNTMTSVGEPQASFRTPKSGHSKTTGSEVCRTALFTIRYGVFEFGS